ncbi:hypothetical protein Tco_0484008 [Tanacetum coccineum]
MVSQQMKSSSIMTFDYKTVQASVVNDKMVSAENNTSGPMGIMQTKIEYTGTITNNGVSNDVPGSFEVLKNGKEMYGKAYQVPSFVFKSPTTISSVIFARTSVKTGGIGNLNLHSRNA